MPVTFVLHHYLFIPSPLQSFLPSTSRQFRSILLCINFFQRRLTLLRIVRSFRKQHEVPRRLRLCYCCSRSPNLQQWRSHFRSSASYGDCSRPPSQPARCRLQYHQYVALRLSEATISNARSLSYNALALVTCIFTPKPLHLSRGESTD